VVRICLDGVSHPALKGERPLTIIFQDQCAALIFFHLQVGDASAFRHMQGPDPQRGKSIGDSFKWLLWFFTAIVMISAGVAIYFREMQAVRQEHDFASFVIKIAAQQAAALCREYTEIELKRKNLEIASKVGESELFSAYRKQMEDQEQNIRDEVSGYRDTILRLVDLRKTVVDEEFNRYVRFLVWKELFTKVQAARIVKLNYQEFVNGNRDLSFETLRKACEDK
jgi:hypothetical protein